MDLEFQDAAGSIHRIVLEAGKEGRFQLRLEDGGLLSGDWRRIGPNCLSLVADDNRSYQVLLARGDDGVHHLHIDGRVVQLHDPQIAGDGNESAGAPSAAGGDINDQGEVLSPMPGKIVDIPVAIGDTVKIGDLLIVLESMKMEHPIHSPVDGAVVGIPVEVGGQAGLGDPLIQLEAAADD